MNRRLAAFVAPGALLLLAAAGLVARSGPRTLPAWPSPAHPLGVDVLGRDFFWVLTRGAAELALPAAAAVLGVGAVLAARLWFATARPVLEEAPTGEAPPWLLLSAPPRLLLVMLAMLPLDQPSTAVAAAVVAALHLPVALAELDVRLAALRANEVLAGLVAHGLSVRRIVARHLLAGHLREPVERLSRVLLVQVAFTQLALGAVFGGSAVTEARSVSWGMELRRYAAALPVGSLTCPPEGACPPLVATMHGALLLLACVLLLGGTLAGARRP